MFKEGLKYMNDPWCFKSYFEGMYSNLQFQAQLFTN